MVPATTPFMCREGRRIAGDHLGVSRSPLGGRACKTVGETPYRGSLELGQSFPRSAATTALLPIHRRVASFAPAFFPTLRIRRVLCAPVADFAPRMRPIKISQRLGLSTGSADAVPRWHQLRCYHILPLRMPATRGPATPQRRAAYNTFCSASAPAQPKYLRSAGASGGAPDRHPFSKL